MICANYDCNLVTISNKPDDDLCKEVLTLLMEVLLMRLDSREVFLIVKTEHMQQD